MRVKRLADRWAGASVVASLVLLLVALSSPSTPLLPFIVVNWLIFVPGVLLLLRNADNQSGNIQVMRFFMKRFLAALLAFAICGSVAIEISNSLVSVNDQSKAALMPA